jgi:hypothetical protein
MKKLTEKEWEFGRVMVILCIDLKKAYDTIKKEKYSQV